MRPIEMELRALIRQCLGPCTQAQQDTSLCVMVAQLEMCNAVVQGDRAKAEQAREVLEKGLTALAKATQVAVWAREVPPEGLSPGAAVYTEVVDERVVVDGMKAELKAVGSLAHMTVWYEAARPKLAKVQDQQLRNEIFDAIRVKKAELILTT